MTILAEAMRQIPMAETLVNQSYRNLQWGKGYFSVLHKGIANQLEQFFYSKPEMQGITPELGKKLQQRVDDLLDQDWADAQAGVYPVELLFNEAWEDFLSYYPQVCLDLPGTWERSHQNRSQDFSIPVERDSYPSYYLQNFHYQTDGYLSEESANLYDIQVELVFGGKADAMRRRILAPMKQALESSFGHLPAHQIQIFDLACGTGRTLLQLRAAFPEAKLYGLDLSQPYLEKAQKLLASAQGRLPKLVAANGESCPYADESFHAISNVFLLHELPQEARHQVLAEMYRCLKPGGVVVICDSIQLHDSPDFSPMMQNFSTLFHEPFYENYVADDLVKALEVAGFSDIQTDIHFLSKYLVAVKKS